MSSANLSLEGLPLVTLTREIRSGATAALRCDLTRARPSAHATSLAAASRYANAKLARTAVARPIAIVPTAWAAARGLLDAHRLATLLVCANTAIGRATAVTGPRPFAVGIRSIVPSARQVVCLGAKILGGDLFEGETSEDRGQGAAHEATERLPARRRRGTQDLRQFVKS